jgi:hypothetical protein
MAMRAIYLASVIAMVSIMPAYADIDGSVPMFCRDSTNVAQPFERTNYSRLTSAFVRQFGWEHSLQQTSETLGVLIFSNTGDTTAPEFIGYDVQPNNGGIELLHMHVRLQGKREDLSGNDMCWRTFGIVNTK